MTPKKLCLLVSSLLCLTVPIISLYVREHCQDHMGKDFVFSIPEMYRIAAGVSPYLSFSSIMDFNVTVYIETPIWSHVDALMDQIILEPKFVFKYKLPLSLRIYGSTLSTQSVHVWSTDSIIVYLTNAEAYSIDSTLIFPSKYLGMEYMVAIYNETSTYPAYFSTVSITSNSDNNQVYLSLPDGIIVTYDTGSSLVKAFGEFLIILSKYQTFQITAHDLSGTQIISAFPVSVVVGHTFLGIGNNAGKDHVLAMLPPVYTLATEYLVIGHPDHTEPTIARIVTTQPSTTINITLNTTITIFASDHGFIHDLTIQPLDAVTITSSAPVVVAILTSSKNRGISGDTSLVFV